MDIIILLVALVGIYVWKFYELGNFVSLNNIHADAEMRKIGYNVELKCKANAFTYYVKSVERLNSL